MEGFGKLVAEEADKILTQENVSHLARQFFTNSNISVNFLASAIGAAILLGLFLLYLLLVNPLGFWGAMMDEMVGYMGSGGERKMCMIGLVIYQLPIRQLWQWPGIFRLTMFWIHFTKKPLFRPQRGCLWLS